MISVAEIPDKILRRVYDLRFKLKRFRAERKTEYILSVTVLILLRVNVYVASYTATQSVRIQSYYFVYIGYSRYTCLNSALQLAII